jgi:phospholipid N-methyltransferase
MLADLDLQAGDVVVEYGPGTGSFTESIHQRSRAIGGLRYLGIEREPGFCTILSRRMPEFDFACGQVEDVERLLAARGLPAPRAILSGLPLILMPTMPQIIATAARILAPGGSFRTFTYLQCWVAPGAHRLRRLFRAHFTHSSRSPLVWRNLPPAWVLRGAN